MNEDTLPAQRSVEEMLAKELAELQVQAMQAWAGREDEGLIAVVRALDAVALASKVDFDGDKSIPIERLNGRHFARIGAASALKPLLAAVKDRQGGVPWGRIDQRTMGQTLDYLRVCGQISHLIRMARLEKYGVAKTTMTGNDAVIEVPHSVPEMATQFAMQHVRMRARKEAKPFVPKGGWSRLRHRMRQYVDAVDGWFIRYDNDSEVGAAFLAKAIEYCTEFFEGEALTDDAQVGGRMFGDWKHAVHQALGRILCHIEFCKLLRFKDPRIGFGNVATIFSRRDDIEAVWLEAGLSPDKFESTMNALTLSIDNIAEWERSSSCLATSTSTLAGTSCCCHASGRSEIRTSPCSGTYAWNTLRTGIAASTHGKLPSGRISRRSSRRHGSRFRPVASNCVVATDQSIQISTLSSWTKHPAQSRSCNSSGTTCSVIRCLSVRVADETSFRPTDGSNASRIGSTAGRPATSRES